MNKDEIITVGKDPDIHGSSIINHSIRYRLSINCSDYVVADFIDRMEKAKKEPTFERAFRHLGIDKNSFIAILYKLAKLNIVDCNTREGWHVTRLWKDFFSAIEDEFADFWTVDKKPCWPGSKSAAQDCYVKARKEETKEYLIKQRNDYFKFLTLPEQAFRQKMMATVFLNTKTKRYSEDWSAYFKPVIETKTNATSADFNKEFGVNK
jgi:hypothetical protein